MLVFCFMLATFFSVSRGIWLADGWLRELLLLPF
jgi:hypothetical protein